MAIPAYNEERRIAHVMEDCISLIGRFGDDITIMVISESSDLTDSIVAGYSNKYRNILLLKSSDRLGKGGAIMKAFKASCEKCGGNDVLGFVDADGSVSAQEVERLVRLLSSNSLDGVMGSRYLAGSKMDGRMPLSRAISSRAYNLLVRMLFGFHYTDTQCASKFFTAKALQPILPRIALKHTTFDIDLLYNLELDGRKIEEVPITYKVVPGGLKPAIIAIFLTTLWLRVSHTWVWGLMPERLRNSISYITNRAR